MTNHSATGELSPADVLISLGYSAARCVRTVLQVSLAAVIGLFGMLVLFTLCWVASIHTFGEDSLVLFVLALEVPLVMLAVKIKNSNW